MTETIEDLFVLIATYTPLLPTIVFFILFKGVKKERVFQIIVAYSIVEFAINAVTVYELLETIYLYPLFTVIEYSLFALLLLFLVKNLLVKKVIFSSIILFLLFSISYYFFVRNKGLDTVPIGIETVLTLAFCFVYLYESMQTESQEFIYHRYSFWIVSAIMLYLGGSFFIYVFANQVDKKTMKTFWAFQNVFSIIKNILFAFSIYIYYTKELRKTRNKLYRYEY
jgi:hypothetical protein